ncbi:MAG: DUF1045 domain-containing protein [Paracoccaceae bacterium]
MFERYAVYYTPAPGTALAEFGAAWLGWDSARGHLVEHLAAVGIDLQKITDRPRKYGFHGTIKPPFRLANGCEVSALEDAVGRLAANLRSVRLHKGLQLARLGRFLALMPAGDVSALNHLASEVVSKLDHFRAPLTEEEFARRRSTRLTPQQDANLARWGYPFVMDEFRFHLTLTGPLTDAMISDANAALSCALANLSLNSFDIDALTVLGERADGRFIQMSRHPLAGTGPL